ncbi:histidinol-phosphate transaminase [Aliiglaciecola sp. CAU 1673]|uniref:pyridoxal phosphate-dependent aminotransferase n=1 Tax=Aliiglaciecola sp. CAU 1673 TaxID=3032595 RepID=UPI0023D9EA29|nr:histidinol-phosphate transaminase [Aliiglaciecola sp. CAU 1673]MDF2177377.1 histidinol-phosphate transaminase [Aliiglaciecola sp. CAU 1673]
MASQHLARRDFIKLLGGAMALGLTPFSLASSALPALRQGQAQLLLHFNENALGMSPNAMLAAQNALLELGNRYPDALRAQLVSALAAKHGVSEEQIVLGNGSSQVLQAAVRWAKEQGAKLLQPSPTFGLMADTARLEGMQVIDIPVGKGFVTDIQAMAKAAAAEKGALLINLCNPNNPTGTIVETKVLTDWIKSSPSNHFFLVDEAYFDYAEGQPGYASALPLVKAGMDNVMVARTFSKVYGMAGLRMGYGLATTNTALAIDDYSAGFNLNAPGLAASLASIEDEAYRQQSLASNLEAKKILLNTLDKLELEYIPSHTNFVLHRINSPLADYQKRMLEAGIRVGRRMTDEDGWNRLSIGTPAQMRDFVNTLQVFRERGWA